MLLPLAMLHLLAFDLLEHVQRWMHHAGYPMLFGLLLSCGVGLPLPEDVPLLLAGYFVARGEMSLVPAAIFAWCGIIGGDCILYAIGRRYGMAITKVPVLGAHIKQERIAKLHDDFEKYGVWVVAVGRMFAGVRGAMVLVAGTIRFTFSHFIIADGLAAIVSGGLFMGLGYWGGKKVGDLHQLHESIAKYSGLALLVVIVGVVALFGWMWWRKRARQARGFTPTAVGAASQPLAADVTVIPSPAAEPAVPQATQVP